MVEGEITASTERAYGGSFPRVSPDVGLDLKDSVVKNSRAPQLVKGQRLFR